MRVVRVSEAPNSFEPEGQPLQGPEPAQDLAASLPLVLVRWHDAWFDSEQQAPEDWRADYLVHTVGFLVRQDPDITSVAQELLPDGDGFRAVTHIPTSTIESIITLFREGAASRMLAAE